MKAMKWTGPRFKRVQPAEHGHHNEALQYYMESQRDEPAFSDYLANVVNRARVMLRVQGLPDTPWLYRAKGTHEWTSKRPYVHYDTLSLAVYIAGERGFALDSTVGLCAQIVETAADVKEVTGEDRDQLMYRLGHLATLALVHETGAQTGGHAGVTTGVPDRVNQAKAARLYDYFAADGRDTHEIMGLIADRLGLPSNTVRQLFSEREDKEAT